MLFFIFLLIPIIEIAGFIFVGDIVGFWMTMLMIIVTAMAGSALLRHQGLETLYKVQSSLEQNQLPLDEMLDGLCLIVAGVLLITPGFFTDIIGFSLFIPLCRNLYKEFFVSPRFLTIVQFTRERGRQTPPPHSEAPNYGADSDITDIDYEIVDEEDKK